jgi:hypothetical protein
MDELELDSEYKPEQKERGSFLTVLCILSFVGNGLGIAQGFMVFTLAGFYSRLFHSMAAVGQGTLRSQVMTIDRIINAVSWFGMAMLVSSVICLIGAILMWRLKKIGLFLYIPFQLIPVIFFIFTLLSFIPQEGQGVVMMFGFFMSVLPIAFIIMFSTQYRQLH